MVKSNSTFIILGQGTDKTTTLIESFTAPNGVYTYTYDENGNITQVTLSNGSTPVYTNYYRYDGRNQLIREENGQDGHTYCYSYLSNGNLSAVYRGSLEHGTLVFKTVQENPSLD